MIIKEKEIDIQNCICEYLSLRNRFFTRTNNVPVFDKSRGVFRRMPKYAVKGFPDIVLFWKGEVVFLEVKTLKGVQSKDQKIFQKECEKEGIKYYLVRSLEDVSKLGI